VNLAEFRNCLEEDTVTNGSPCSGLPRGIEDRVRWGLI